jgi:hypothetical protein
MIGEFDICEIWAKFSMDSEVLEAAYFSSSDYRDGVFLPYYHRPHSPRILAYRLLL